MLNLSTECRKAIEQHGEQGYPEEICGYLLGKMKGDVRTVTGVRAVENYWEPTLTGDGNTTLAPEFEDESEEFTTETRRRRFWIPGDEYVRVDTDARKNGLDIVGFYHSHPNHPARPSLHDLNVAQQSIGGYSYVIVAVHQGKSVDLTSWVLSDDYSRFDAEEIESADDHA